MKRFPFYYQLDNSDCGATCLRMIAKYHGRHFTAQSLREKTQTTTGGTSLQNIVAAAEDIGLKTLAAKIPFTHFKESAPLPCVVHWNSRHFVVIYKIAKGKVHVADPAHGLIKYKESEFLNKWTKGNPQDEIGTALFLEPSKEFYHHKDQTAGLNFGLLYFYLSPYRKYIFQIILGILAGSILQLVFPFLTQSLVDIGIQNHNIGFVNLILLAQLMLLFSRMVIEFIRSRMLLYIGARVNISLISDFLIKFMKLPVSFTDGRMIGDITQRISDHNRIESFMTYSLLNSVLSFTNLIIFGIVIAYYNFFIFSIFFIGSAIYIFWIAVFYKKRAEYDYKLFETSSLNQSGLIQMINGIKDIKLSNSESQKKWEWENTQAQLFRINLGRLNLNQYQQAGSMLINETKNLMITFISAKYVISGEITLGMMLSIQYIIGQLNSPINQLISFINSFQDAKISLERLNEVHSRKNEEENSNLKIKQLPKEASLEFRNLHFKYEGTGATDILQDISVVIPHGKVTAIVGSSGSGKTTLLKLILKFYKPSKGKLLVGDFSLEDYCSRMWRDRCSAVLQDGFIFYDTIAKNIALGSDELNMHRLVYAAKAANLYDLIDSLPLGFNTKIGNSGHGLSTGQKQRVLIARAVYKNPEFIVFDEATNSLDAKNEKQIMDNIYRFFDKKTVIIAAHRLSTIKNADQIIVMDKGRVVEVGNHDELLVNRNLYFELVRNQMEFAAALA